MFQTVFEVGQSSHIVSYKVMKTKRTRDNETIFRFRQKVQTNKIEGNLEF